MRWCFDFLFAFYLYLPFIYLRDYLNLYHTYGKLLKNKSLPYRKEAGFFYRKKKI